MKGPISDSGPLLPTVDEQQAYFDSWNVRHRSCDLDHIDNESKARAAAVLRAVEAFRVPRPSILEIGCGTGWLIERLADVGDCTGIDLSKRAIEIARQRGIKATFHVANFHTFSGLQASFDIGICMETISYVADREVFIDRLASMLKPGGLLILTSTNKFIYMRRSDIGPPEPGQIRKWLTRRELLNLLERRFKILKTTTVLPKGDRGILRVTQSYKINGLLNRMFGEAAVTRAKEAVGLGHCRVVLAQKR